ncbi:hypothetical protein [Limobrevibacterium gyesilva]|uniref:Uncharacterized protein n=1 Tax=Limobrevibacterium gyesilva TaxID=2991712 RepID=A0AA41YIL5_9PROT|nr:hypothetical protein [Limobrevibacterium gyesilva]MCW3473100.1 hypothetical protein [Limobrevibacterium gyesilva]
MDAKGFINVREVVRFRMPWRRCCGILEMFGIAIDVPEGRLSIRVEPVSDMHAIGRLWRLIIHHARHGYNSNGLPDDNDNNN